MSNTEFLRMDGHNDAAAVWSQQVKIWAGVLATAGNRLITHNTKAGKLTHGSRIGDLVVICYAGFFLGFIPHWSKTEKDLYI